MQNIKERSVLPRISLAGTEFYIDIRLMEMRQVDQWFNRISLNQLDVTRDGEHYLLFFNKKKNTLFTNNSNVELLPKHVVCLKIPHELALDPIVYARKMGQPDNAFLHLFPAVDLRQAEEIDVNSIFPGRRLRPKQARLVRSGLNKGIKK
ncbi:hypothetical protein [Niastella sp. OAS944]|uniref:hypothetical protein n=1 Tax=Niastella sp. OAS944 TaxID=2664089 RepID=UPI003470CA87|nr:hypothetical protein [Chitinophagaceae bacterium OAS944]